MGIIIGGALHWWWNFRHIVEGTRVALPSKIKVVGTPAITEETASIASQSTDVESKQAARSQIAILKAQRHGGTR